jgi:hypothetical protein
LARKLDCSERFDFYGTIVDIPHRRGGGDDGEGEGGGDDKLSITPPEFEDKYPNPFNATVNIPFMLHQSSMIALTAYNVSGRKVATIARSDYKLVHIPFSGQKKELSVVFISCV